jgi:lipopolysaccharide export system protein LptA
MTRLPTALLLILCATVTAAGAPSSNAPPNALQGFSQNRDQPVAIESATLEVREKDKVATFSGSVKLVQGDTTLTCKTLTVFYEGGSGDAKPVRQASAGQQGAANQANQKIKRIEAKGGVRVVQKDQTATGDSGTFDMASNTVTLSGNVAMTQGPNIVKGDRLWVDLNSGVSRVESGSSSDGRVRALLNPGSVKEQKEQRDRQDAGGDGKKSAPRGSGAKPVSQ